MKIPTSLRLDEDVLNAVNKIAEEQERSTSQTIEILLREQIVRRQISERKKKGVKGE